MLGVDLAQPFLRKGGSGAVAQQAFQSRIGNSSAFPEVSLRLLSIVNCAFPQDFRL